jgi:glutamyl-tRNA reductase
MTARSWRLVVCGTSHKTSSLEEREPFQLGAEEVPRANAVFGGLPEVMESAILSTCNRVEFYFVTAREREPLDIVEGFYRDFKALDVPSARHLFQAKKGRHAADHLFRVSAGIDSMVVGENQILGQVKDAYSSACAVKSAGKVIHRLFHQAFRVGKRVRSETEVGKGACSVSSAALEMLAEVLDPLDTPTVLLVGVNQMTSLAAKRLRQGEGRQLLFANRTAEKAVEFASGFDADGFGLDQLPGLIAQADVVITCTSSPEPIITQPIMTDALKHRRDSRLVVVDMAIPRDVDIPKDWDPAIEVKDLEDIKRFVDQRQHQRELAIPQAEEIIERRLDEFDYWYGHVLHEPIYNGRASTIDIIREEELAPILEKLPSELRNELNQATRRIVDRVVKVTNRTSVKRSE